MICFFLCVVSQLKRGTEKRFTLIRQTNHMKEREKNTFSLIHHPFAALGDQEKKDREKKLLPNGLYHSM